MTQPDVDDISFVITDAKASTYLFFEPDSKGDSTSESTNNRIAIETIKNINIRIIARHKRLQANFDHLESSHYELTRNFDILQNEHNHMIKEYQETNRWIDIAFKFGIGVAGILGTCGIITDVVDAVKSIKKS